MADLIPQVNQELCAGCGICVNECPKGAIQLVDHHAAIQETLCTLCEACFQICPNGAITAHPKEENIQAIAVPPNVEVSLAPFQEMTKQIEAKPSAHIASLASAALTFLGHEVAPKVVDVLLNVLEQKLTPPTQGATTTLEKKPAQERERRQMRRRYRQTEFVNRKRRR